MDSVSASIQTDLKNLCASAVGRPPGSPANQAASAYIAQRFQQATGQVELAEFECLYWPGGKATLQVDGHPLTAYPGPYSPGTHYQGGFIAVENVAELTAINMTGKVAVLHGSLCQEQLMPKNFPFYNPIGHQQIYQIIEQKQPAAIVTVTTRNPSLVGGIYPFPLFEDGDFNIPSVYMADNDGALLLSNTTANLNLIIDSQRIPSRAANIIARQPGSSKMRILVTAHLDSKPGTPGALDNATGVAMLLALADRLAGRSLPFTVELVAINGEDDYSAAGERRLLTDNQNRMSEIALNINLDAPAYRDAPDAFCTFDCHAQPCRAITDLLLESGLNPIDPIYQGDHMIFAQNRIPAILITSQAVESLTAEIVHTALDTLEQVDPFKIQWLAESLSAILSGNLFTLIE